MNSSFWCCQDIFEWMHMHFILASLDWMMASMWCFEIRKNPCKLKKIITKSNPNVKSQMILFCFVLKNNKNEGMRIICIDITAEKRSAVVHHENNLYIMEEVFEFWWLSFLQKYKNEEKKRKKKLHPIILSKVMMTACQSAFWCRMMYISMNAKERERERTYSKWFNKYSRSYSNSRSLNKEIF